MEESKVVNKFLRSVPYRYRQIMVVIQTLHDVGKLTLVNATGCLKVAEEELEAPPSMVSQTAELYLLEEAWEEKWKLGNTKKPSGNGPGGGGGGHSSRGRRNGAAVIKMVLVKRADMT
jgi:hypothetical protein